MLVSIPACVSAYIHICTEMARKKGRRLLLLTAIFIITVGAKGLLAIELKCGASSCFSASFTQLLTFLALKRAARVVDRIAVAVGVQFAASCNTKNN